MWIYPNGDVLLVSQATSKGYAECSRGGCFDLSFPESKFRRGRVQDKGNICPTLMAGGCEIYVYEGVEHGRKSK